MYTEPEQMSRTASARKTRKKALNLSSEKVFGSKKEGTIWAKIFFGPCLYVNEAVDQMYVKKGHSNEVEYRMWYAQ